MLLDSKNVFLDDELLGGGVEPHIEQGDENEHTEVDLVNREYTVC